MLVVRWDVFLGCYGAHFSSPNAILVDCHMHSLIIVFHSAFTAFNESLRVFSLPAPVSPAVTKLSGISIVSLLPSLCDDLVS